MAGRERRWVAAGHEGDAHGPDASAGTAGAAETTAAAGRGRPGGDRPPGRRHPGGGEPRERGQHVVDVGLGHGGVEPAGRPGDREARSGETLLTDGAASKVKAAALAAVPGGTVIRVETDSAGSPYEAHVRKADGSIVTVKVDKDFHVTSTESGFGAGGPGGPGGYAPNGQSTGA
jgi:hypothetical protein